MMKKLYLLCVTAVFITACFASDGVPGKSPEFIVGRDNPDSAISRLESLTGLSIKKIERRARPCAHTSWSRCSTAGFLGKDESFIERLLVDNRFVHSMGYTHREMAKPLFILKEMKKKHCVRINSEKGLFARCSYNGWEYDVLLMCTKGVQESIFNDGLRTSCLVNAKKLKDGKEVDSLLYDSDLLPNYIRLYGFYEGNTSFRLPPERIIEFFGLLKKDGGR